MLASHFPQPVDVDIPTANGPTLHATVWFHPDPRGLVIIAHGLGEHGGAYGEVASTLREVNGVEVIAPDLRGHGRSPGRRGVVRLYNELTADYVAAFHWGGERHPGTPRFLFGHSNGGQIAIRAALSAEISDGVAGLIVSNPCLRLATKVPVWKRAFGRVLLNVAPWVTLGVPLGTETLTRDSTLWESRRADPLRHSRISAPLYFGMIDGGPILKAQVAELTMPVLFLIGGSDQVVDPQFNLEVFENITHADKTLRYYPEMVHEPLNDLGRERVVQDLQDWFEQHLPTAKGLKPDPPAPIMRERTDAPDAA